MAEHAPSSGDERWLAAMLPFVLQHLPQPPADVLEVGCGPLGGFVPSLSVTGYRCVGVDPEAPDGPAYQQVPFEEYAADKPVDAVIASLSLHHVTSVDSVLDLIGGLLKTDGVLVILEWASERFDEPTAQWCFARLPARGDEPGWLQRRYDAWRESGLGWDDYRRASIEEEGLHGSDEIIASLQDRFHTVILDRGPYFFPDLAASRDEEQGAIDAGRIRPNGVRYVGRPRGPRAPA